MDSIGTLRLKLIGALFEVVKIFLVVFAVGEGSTTAEVAGSFSSLSVGGVDRLNHWGVAVLLKSLIGGVGRRLLLPFCEGDTLLLLGSSHREKSKAVLLPSGVGIVHGFAVVEGTGSLIFLPDSGLLLQFFIVHLFDDGDKFSLIFL